MKKLFIFGLMFLPFVGLSQVKKEQWLIGGNGMFTWSKSKTLTLTSWQLTPAVGYFFMDKFAAGLRGNFFSDKYDYGSSGKFRFATVTIGPFVRYYFLPTDQKVNLFADAAFGYSWGKNRNWNPEGHSNYHYYNAAFMFGPAIFLNEHTALEITLGYNYLSRGPVDTTITHRIQVGVGLQIHLGK
jgi:hypothetical protein